MKKVMVLGMTFWDWRRVWRIAFIAVVVLAIGEVSAQAQDQNNQSQTNESQRTQDRPSQNQPNQNQSDQSRTNQNQSDQNQTNQGQSSSNPDKAGQDQQQQPQPTPAQQPAQQPQNPSQQPQQTSPSQGNGKQENDNDNPAASAAQATKQVAIQAAEATKKLGQATFVKVRDWEVGWATGPYVGRQREMVPMTSAQRRDIYLQQTFLAPSDYFKRMFSAGIDQARGTPRQWGGGWGGYGKRFASREGQFFAANTLAAFGNAKLKYEPRYDQCRCSGFKLRTRHAIMRNFLTYNETERELRPQLALYGGAFSGGVISTAWKPHPRNALVNGGFAVLGQAGYGALLNFFVEFAGDINRKLGSKR